jgi:glycosyltransferase involved in cell wall biosynthesis
MSRPRLLVLTQSLPYPPQSGVANRTFNVLRQLSLAYDIDLLAFARVNHHPDGRARATAREALSRVATHVAEPTPIPNERSMTRRLWDHLRSLLHGRPYTYYEYDSDTFALRLNTLLRTQAYDLVHLDSLDMHRWLAELPRVPVACTHHNLESQLLRRYAAGLSPAIVRQYVRLQARRLERLERDVCPRLDLNVMVSDIDARGLAAIAPGAVTTVVPNGTDVEFFQPRGDKAISGRVAFVGPTYSFPNRDAVEFFLDEMWPNVRRRTPHASLHLVGRNAAADAARYSSVPDVTPLGHVADIRDPLAQASCCVVPIRIGGGTRLKILDAWAMGKAIVSTAIGCEGLEARDGENILIRDEPDAFAAAVSEVLRDDALRVRLEQNARRTALDVYAWDRVGRRLRDAYDALLVQPSRSVAVG